MIVNSLQGYFMENHVTDGAIYRTKIHCYFLDQVRTPDDFDIVIIVIFSSFQGIFVFVTPYHSQERYPCESLLLTTIMLL